MVLTTSSRPLLGKSQVVSRSLSYYCILPYLSHNVGVSLIQSEPSGLPYRLPTHIKDFVLDCEQSLVCSKISGTSENSEHACVRVGGWAKCEKRDCPGFILHFRRPLTVRQFAPTPNF